MLSVGLPGGRGSRTPNAGPPAPTTRCWARPRRPPSPRGPSRRSGSSSWPPVRAPIRGRPGRRGAPGRRRARVVVLWGERVGHGARGAQGVGALLALARDLDLAGTEGAGLLEVPQGTNARGLREGGACPTCSPASSRPRRPAAPRGRSPRGSARTSRRCSSCTATPCAPTPSARRGSGPSSARLRSWPSPTSSPRHWRSTPTWSSRPPPTPSGTGPSRTRTVASSACARASATPRRCARPGPSWPTWARASASRRRSPPRS